MCAESNATMPNQSIEIVDFGTTSPAAFPGPGTAHTVLFSAIDVPYGWLSTGGVSIGDEITLIDIASNQYMVKGILTASGTEATPFSASVS